MIINDHQTNSVVIGNQLNHSLMKRQRFNTLPLSTDCNLVTYKDR